MLTNNNTAIEQGINYHQQLSLIESQNKWRLDIARQMKMAIKSGQIDIVKDLLNRGLITPTSYHLYDAVLQGQPTIVELFLQRGVNVNSADSYYNQKPIYAAILKNNLEIVDILVRYGADYFTPDLVITHQFLLNVNSSSYKAVLSKSYKEALSKLTPDTRLSPLGLAMQLQQTEIENCFLKHTAEEQARIKRCMSIENIITRGPEQYKKDSVDSTVLSDAKIDNEAMPEVFQRPPRP